MSAWKGEAATDHSKRDRARRALRLVGVPCARCGQPATERHHRTGNLDDYTLTEIEPMCSACHDGADTSVRLHKPKVTSRVTSKDEAAGGATEPDDTYHRKTVRFDLDVFAGIRAIAERKGLSENAVINEMCRTVVLAVRRERARRGLKGW